MQRKDVYRSEGDQTVFDHAEIVIYPEEIDIVTAGLQVAMIKVLNDAIAETDPTLRAEKQTVGFKLLDTFSSFTIPTEKLTLGE
jgi:hypothetical protein